MSRSGRNTRRLTATEIDLTVTRQLALVVGTATNERSREECDSSLEELVQLVDTAGADVVERVVQSRERPHPATYVGSGKAQEIKMLTQALDVDVVVFDDELAPNQQRNLEKILECDVVDRTALILDIFAQHATTQEGMVQVELAQLRYPHASPKWTRVAAKSARWWYRNSRARRNAPRSRSTAYPHSYGPT